jgi:xylulokinase
MTRTARAARPTRAGRDPLYLGLDLGTSGLKAVAVDDTGRVVASARAGYPTARTASGAAEQDPADWIRAAEHALGQLAGRAAPGWRSASQR